MSSNGVNITEDADMAECDGEKVVTMMDVLQEQQEFEEDANAVLGASDDKNCTFLKGYIKRQALYACLTCCSDAKTDPTKRAGVCLACSLNCHENHELIELYTKRNFRCDCGNPKFNSHPCQYTPDKPDLNEENSYNQNFSGLYCTCQRPYPDPDTTFEDEMIQCIICEDWLHATHLEAPLPSNEQYAEMICKACMEKNAFLHDYSDIAVNSESADVDVTSVNNTDTPEVDKTSENGTPKVNGVLESSEVTDDNKTKIENNVEMSENDKNNIELNTENEGEKMEDDKESTILTTENADEKIEDKSTTPDTTDENKTDVPVPDTASITKEDDNSKQSCEKESEALTETENDKPDETTASTTEDVNSIPNDIASESAVKDNEESVEKQDIPQSEENKMETSSHQNAADAVDKNESNADSIIESIEKLENELGNVESKDKAEENEQIPTNLNDSSNNDDNNKTESKDEDSITASAASDEVESDSKAEPSQEDKQQSAELKTSDIEMNEQNNAIAETENNTSNDEKVESTENVKNGTIENEVSNEINIQLEAKPEETTNDSKRKLSTEESDEVSMKKPKLDATSSCCRPRGVKRIFKGATFWPAHFRQKLCTCNECITMYKDLSVLFLTDPEDTVTAYEALGKQRIDGSASSQYERGLEALSSLDRIQQINALTEYNKMRDKLLDFLKSFKDRKEVVKEEDIKAFFAGMKPKREPDGVYFCR